MSNKKYIQSLEKEIRENISVLDATGIQSTYGIVINDNGTVYDDVLNYTYPDLNNWITVYLDDSEEDIEYIGANKGWLDD
jgi:hypothetical protein